MDFKEHPSFNSVVDNYLGGNVENLNNIEHAAKLSALKQLLTDLGIASSDGENDTSASGGVSGNVVSQHRALIFCQLKTMLDILENDLLR